MKHHWLTTALLVVCVAASLVATTLAAPQLLPELLARLGMPMGPFEHPGEPLALLAAAAVAAQRWRG